MQQSSPKSASLRAFKCRLMGHNFKVTQKVTNYVNEYKCTCCKKEVSDNSTGGLDTLTNRTREINQSLRDLFTRRRQHRLSNY